MTFADVLDHAYLEWAALTDADRLDAYLDRKVRESSELPAGGDPPDEGDAAQARLEAMLAQ